MPLAKVGVDSGGQQSEPSADREESPALVECGSLVDELPDVVKVPTNVRQEKPRRRALIGDCEPIGRLQVEQYLTYWLTEIAVHRVRPSTLASYRWLARTYVVPYIGSRKLARVRPSDIRTFLDRLKSVCQCCALGKDVRRVERGQPARCCALVPRRCCGSFLSDGSIRYAHRVIRAAFQDAVSDDLIASNVAKGLRISHRYRPKFTPWAAEDARRFSLPLAMTGYLLCTRWL